MVRITFFSGSSAFGYLFFKLEGMSKKVGDL